MEISLEIFYQDNYEIHKKFHCYVPHLAGYLIKTIGLDFDSKNSEIILPHKDSVYRKPNEKFLLLIRELPKRKKRRQKNKIEKHELTDPV